MNRAKVKNLLRKTASSSAAVTVTETNPFTRNLILSIYRNNCRRLYAMPVTLTATETMPVTPDSS
ncbi:MAG: hypothetical protein WBQ38_00830 [Ignavibacteria bacterium]